jgi:hypothetical protein
MKYDFTAQEPNYCNKKMWCLMAVLEIRNFVVLFAYIEHE